MITLSRSMNDNLTKIELPGLTIWFSYETPIAFRDRTGRHVSANQWSTTTGRHLSSIDGGDKSSRIESYEKFMSMLERAYLEAGV